MNFSNAMMPFPFVIQPATPPENHERRDEWPARVRLAVQVHAALTAKTAPTPLPLKLGSQDSVEFEPMPGQKLTEAEEDLLQQSALLLTKYIAGQLPPTVSEKREQKRLDRLEDRQDLVDGGSLLSGDMMQVGCTYCSNNPMLPRHKCPKCHGQGYVFIPFARTEAT